jgi:hypothetical protein
MSETPAISFIVPAMSFDVKTKNSDGKKVNKLGTDGRVKSVEKIIPKERPRFGRAANGRTMTYTPKDTHDFEAWIRRHFFRTYPSSGGVWSGGRGWPVADQFLGCRWLGEKQPCQRFKAGKDFLDCQACTNRRKNLALNLEVHLKDERHLDLDNMIKIVLDALNRTFFYDDTQFVRKKVALVPYSVLGEHLNVQVSVLPTQFIAGSILGGYSIKNMVIEKAQAYIKTMWDTLCSSGKYTPEQATEELVAYVQRCDKRKYVETLGGWLNQVRTDKCENK